MTDGSRRIGDREVALLLDGIFEPPPGVVVHPDGVEARDRALGPLSGDAIRIDVNAFLLRGPDGITLVDAGTGHAWGPALGHARTALERHGIAPGQVDRVLLTHIHGDHALGLLDGEEPWLPRAEILVPERDLGFFTDAVSREATPPERRSGFDIAEKLVRAYAGRLRGVPAGEVLPGIELLPLPGHTPGHVGYLLRGEGEGGSLLLWGDLLHLAGPQSADPALSLTYDLDPAEARRSRKAGLERAAAAGWLVTGGHVTGFSRVRAEGMGFRMVAG
ncbi:ribonuclease Z [Roseomonas sp. TAS13]|uniref:AidB family quorum-quenching N-acyl homoserine lactonase n=1 Tax=Roseomonas sp. TAS13 TaxID=1926319 RepID=UPI0009686EAD|nr:MBL fold metallo-hydrolase [Roseomonas sp. TAS13]USQ72099.1 MBL fold metallo-hydrolase [Roseomonas mucosa]GAV36512.1 ribonuclease Z [Roseomonas sp. TAS13]